MNDDRLFSLLRPIEAAAYDYVDSDIVVCHEGTRIDLLQQVDDWAQSEDGPSIFWLSGLAGTGKSTISRTVAQRLDGDRLGGSFFFKRGGGDRSHARRFFPTLAYQLARMLPRLYQRLLDILRAEPGIATKDIRNQFETLIQRPLSEDNAMAESGYSSKNLIIVVDALDECDPSDVKLVVQLLLSTNLKCFITTRPEYRVRSFFKSNEESHQLLVLHHVDQAATEHDIRIYIQSRLACLRDEYNANHDDSEDAALPDGWPGHNALRNLTQLALPLFISAATICRMIEDPNWILSPDERIQDILNSRSRGQGAVESIYTQVLTKLSLHGEASNRFRDIVGSVILLFDALDSKSLSTLLQIDRRAVDTCLDPLHSVLDIASPSAPIKIFHLSFREFLLGPSAPEVCKIDDKQAHTMLARRCCQLLLRHLRKDMCDISSPGRSRTEIDDRLIHDRLSPQLQYAAWYWVGHLTSSGISMINDDEFHQLLKTKFLMWLEVLSLTDRMSGSIDMIDDLLEAVHVSHSSSRQHHS